MLASVTSLARSLSPVNVDCVLVLIRVNYNGSREAV